MPAEARGSGRARPSGARRAAARAPAPTPYAAARAARASRARAAAARPGRARRRCPSALRKSPSRSASSAVAAHDHPEQDVVVAGERLRRAVEDEVGAVLERPQVGRRDDRRVDEDAVPACARARAVEVRKREERVRRRLDPDEIDVVGRRAGLVVLDVAEAPALERAEGDAGAVVGVARRARSFAPGSSMASTSAVVAPAPEGKSTRVPALELRERGLRGRDAGRVAVALVVEAARLARPRTARWSTGRAGASGIAPPSTRLAAVATTDDRPTPRGLDRGEARDGCSELRDEALHAGTEQAVERQREAGKLLARERAERCSTPARSSSSTGMSATASRTSGCSSGGRTATRS